MTMNQGKEASQTRPPDWLFKGIINPTMKVILRSPLHGILSNGLSIITFTGRKSSKQYSTPVAYHVEDDNTVYVFSRSKWWKNLQNGEPVTIRIRGKDYTGTPEVITDPDAAWTLIAHYLEKYDGNARLVGIMSGKDATEEELRAAGSDMIAIKIRFD